MKRTQLHDKLFKKGRDRFSYDSVNMPVSEWVCKNTTLAGKPFSIEGYEFQKQILDDMHPNMDVIKISQVGLTEISLRKMLAFLVRNQGTSGIFSLPTEDMFERVSASRIKPLIASDQVFNTEKDRVNRSVRSKDMMQFGNSFLYVVAAIETAATSTPADILMNDEVDLSNQKILALFGSRLQNSVHKISQRFSTPTFPNYGIDMNWQSSDQHYYMIRCSSCGFAQTPEFEWKYLHIPGLPDLESVHDIQNTHRDLIDMDSCYVKCEKCSKPLDLTQKGEWVSKYPSRIDSRGYRVSPFCTSKISIQYILTELWKYQRVENIRGWYNTVIGKPFSDGNSQIPEEAISRSFTDDPVGRSDLTGMDGVLVGIDMGQTCHITIGVPTGQDEFEVLRMYSVTIKELVDHVRDLYQQCPNLRGTIDRHPYEPTAREIFELTEGKIMPIEYRGGKEIHLVNNEFGETSHAQANHTMFLDAVARLFKTSRVRINGYGHSKRAVMEQFRDMVRSEKPGEPARWIKLTGNDHFFHSLGFMIATAKVFDLYNFKYESSNSLLFSSSVVLPGGPKPAPNIYLPHTYKD